MNVLTRVCERCGAAIPPDAPQHSCGACLLEAALAAAEHERDVNVDPAPSPMLMDFGDYELLEQIGRGGQGVVFRARQKSLNRTVALKIIGLGQWASKAHLKRFRLEAEAAARLEHPGIVPIHEVGERDGSCYFSMKFVEGGQLDAVPKREPMPIRQAAELIAKVARTVHYAHEHGILHRDIKPGNILLDAKGEPHLTDFGLARLVESESSVTQTLDVLGTPSYMAPEQAVGNNTAVSSTTDVYGLGAVLYQLLTGQPPFAGGTTYETIKLLLDTEPREPRLLNPKIDRDLSTICLKCLEKDPKRRYSSALALARDLERWLKHEPIQARRTGVFARGAKWVRRNPTSALLAASLIALAAGAGWIVWKSEFITRPATSGVAVLPFENLSGDSDNAYFVDGMQEEILTKLASIAGLKVISRNSTRAYQSKSRNLREIAMQLGVANIIEGSVQKSADQVRVNVQLINALTDSHLWADTYDRKLTDIFGVESEIAKGIADQLQARLTVREQQAIADKPTNNPAAYDAYLRGLALARGPSFATESGSLAAAKAFEEAVNLAPDFALAWAELARTNAYLYVSEVDTSPARWDQSAHALEMARRLRPDADEILLAQAYYEYWVVRDYDGAKAKFTQLRQRLPSNADVAMALALIARRQGLWNESLTQFEEASQLNPLDVFLLNEWAKTATAMRQFSVALELFDRVLSISPNNPTVIANKAIVYQITGDLESAGKLLTGLVDDSAGDLVAVQDSQLWLQRRYADLVKLLQDQLVKADPSLGIQNTATRVELGEAQLHAGNVAAAKGNFLQALTELKSFEERHSDSFLRPYLLSHVFVGLGRNQEAVQQAERAVGLLPSSRDAVTGPCLEANLAMVFAHMGENDRAIAALERLLKVPALWQPPLTPALLRLDPIWDPLRADPIFQKLCEEKQK